ncbi:MAG: GDSL-type esterase/lipase family protein [Propionibacteriales bacterium]|nr:GDSL-type esterase/lipase family protein [Propionibacteriales bacterium]
MKANLLTVGALAAALVLTGVSLGRPATAASAANPTRIMLAGDSITSGIDGDYTWRYRLDQELDRQRTGDRVDFVGPLVRPRGSYWHYLGGRDWDSDHNATTGTELDDQLTQIGPQVETYQPDILVSYLGTNDFLDVPRSNPGRSQAELLPLYQARTERVLADWKSYLNAVRAARPTIKIVLGELVSPKIPQSIRDTYNARLQELAGTTWFALGSPVEIAQLAGNIWSSSRYLYDTVHPTPTGETYLAQRFAEAIRSVEDVLFPAPIEIERPNVAWDPALRPRISVSGQRIQVGYAYTARFSSIRSMRVRLGDARTGKVSLGPFRTIATASTWTSARLRPGTYRIRLQGKRVYMASTWSQVYTVRVTKAG